MNPIFQPAKNKSYKFALLSMLTQLDLNLASIRKCKPMSPNCTAHKS